MKLKSVPHFSGIVLDLPVRIIVITLNLLHYDLRLLAKPKPSQCNQILIRACLRLCLRQQSKVFCVRDMS